MSGAQEGEHRVQVIVPLSPQPGDLRLLGARELCGNLQAVLSQIIQTIWNYLITLFSVLSNFTIHDNTDLQAVGKEVVVVLHPVVHCVPLSPITDATAECLTVTQTLSAIF